ncbi:MAG: hypothetical protein WC123_08205 [Bacilli bacterium]
MYIYESHLGGLFTTKEKLSFEDLYCEQCGDWDQLLGRANTKDEFSKLINEEEWIENYIQNFVKTHFD